MKDPLSEKTGLVVIMRGQPGSGKSTWAKKKFPRALFCSAGDYHMKDGSYQWKPENQRNAHGSCRYKFERALDEGVSIVVVDNTNTTVKEMKFYFEMARVSGYETQIIRMTTDVFVSAGRNVHGVPLESVQRMAERMQGLPDTWPKESLVRGE